MVKEEKHLDIRGVEGRYWNENASARTNGLRRKAETAISCREPGSTRKKRHTSSREEEDVATNMCPCGTTIESRTHIVGECETYKEERDALEEMRKLGVCVMEEFGRLESSENTIAILGDGWRPQMAKQDGERIIKHFYVTYGGSVKSAQMLEVSLLGVGTVLRLKKGCVVIGQMTKSSNK